CWTALAIYPHARAGRPADTKSSHAYLMLLPIEVAAFHPAAPRPDKPDRRYGDGRTGVRLSVHPRGRLVSVALVLGFPRKDRRTAVSRSRARWSPDLPRCLSAPRSPDLPRDGIVRHPRHTPAQTATIRFWFPAGHTAAAATPPLSAPCPILCSPLPRPNSPTATIPCSTTPT